MKADHFHVLAAKNGTRFFASGTNFTGQNIVGLLVVADAQFSNLEESNKDGSLPSTGDIDVTGSSEQNISGATIPAGTPLYPSRDIFSRINLSSGSVIGIRG